MALTTDGSAYSWGWNQFGGNGVGVDNGNANYSIYPVSVPDGVTFSKIVAGATHYLGITTDGQVYGWGANDRGQLGNGATAEISGTPTLVNVPDGVTFVDVDAGFNTSLAIDSTGQVWAWGENGEGALGDDTTTDRLDPVKVAAPAGVTFTAIAAGSRTSAALSTDGQIYTWGFNYYGALGNGTTSTTNPNYSTTPGLATSPAGVTFTDVEAGDGSFIAIGDDGNSYGWGQGQYTPIGDGTTNSYSVPTKISMPAGVNLAKLDSSVNGYHWIAQGTDGLTYVWGSNTSEPPSGGSGTDVTGQLGNDSGEQLLQPTVLTLPTCQNPPSITAGTLQTAMVDCNGDAYVWGSRSGGYLGQIDYTQPTSTSPLLVTPPARTITSVTFDGIAGTELTANDDGSYSVITPAHPAGPVDVVVTSVAAGDLDSRDTTYTLGFTYLATPVATVPPTQDGQTVTIPTVPGVDYYYDGDIVTGTITVAEGETITVTAQAQPDFVLTADSATSWDFSVAAPTPEPTSEPSAESSNEPSAESDVTASPATDGAEIGTGGNSADVTGLLGLGAALAIAGTATLVGVTHRRHS